MAKAKLSGPELEARRKALRSECKDYEPEQGGYGCKHYAGRGACRKPDYFMCVVWLKRNPDEAEEMRATALAEKKQKAAVSAAQPTPPPAVRGRTKDHAREQPVADRRPPPREAKTAEVYDLSRYGVDKDDGDRPLLANPELLTEEAVDELSRLGIEVAVKTSSGVTVTLVPETTSQDRCELTYKHARSIVMVLQVFPGATLESISKPKKEEAS